MAKSVTPFMSRDGEFLTKQRHAQLLKDEDYCRILQYANDEYHVTVLWHGRIDYRASPDYWTPYELMVKTNLDGRWVNDPFSSKQCKSVKEATKYYEEFLVNYTDCDIKKDISGQDKFYEVANNLAPPPPDPDIPHVSEATSFLTGSW
ncbi:hypothetical protein UFOVP26_29 [uncultured Caudovirales phage]|uniref:Uncharacterized protein n=1 Tax=uncultured Caudovirales phage TaxID=2100421 RepID=A0A6J7WNB7_9CAUD|nr:hypothetical protein UFOVP26_29 [uncultured Caudovirales phage]CAB4123852.1 hypothetical protein UFOVP44_68 [uncultured Caudovirales phage]CAB5219290.1 hypothetical protein UFOVP220_59 [uncultured Caudovirales phage]